MGIGGYHGISAALCWRLVTVLLCHSCQGIILHLLIRGYTTLTSTPAGVFLKNLGQCVQSCVALETAGDLLFRYIKVVRR